MQVVDVLTSDSFLQGLFLLVVTAGLTGLLVPLVKARVDDREVPRAEGLRVRARPPGQGDRRAGGAPREPVGSPLELPAPVARRHLLRDAGRQGQAQDRVGDVQHRGVVVLREAPGGDQQGAPPHVTRAPRRAPVRLRAVDRGGASTPTSRRRSRAEPERATKPGRSSTTGSTAKAARGSNDVLTRLAEELRLVQGARATSQVPSVRRRSRRSAPRSRGTRPSPGRTTPPPCAPPNGPSLGGTCSVNPKLFELRVASNAVLVERLERGETQRGGVSRTSMECLAS